MITALLEQTASVAYVTFVGVFVTTMTAFGARWIVRSMKRDLQDEVRAVVKAEVEGAVRAAIVAEIGPRIDSMATTQAHHEQRIVAVEGLVPRVSILERLAHSHHPTTPLKETHHEDPLEP